MSPIENLNSKNLPPDCNVVIDMELVFSRWIDLMAFFVEVEENGGLIRKFNSGDRSGGRARVRIENIPAYKIDDGFVAKCPVKITRTEVVFLGSAKV